MNSRDYEEPIKEEEAAKRQYILVDLSYCCGPTIADCLYIGEYDNDEQAMRELYEKALINTYQQIKQSNVWANYKVFEVYYCDGEKGILIHRFRIDFRTEFIK